MIEGFSIGREPSNRLSIEDALVSRRHCVVRKQGEQYRLADLDSTNGTFVNGVPVKDRVLEAGDEIKIGDSVFLFHFSDPGAPVVSSSVQLDETVAATQSTVVLRREDALYLQPESSLEALPPSARLVRDLNALLKISTVVYSIQALHTSRGRPLREALERQLLDLIFEAIPAERGAILLAEGTHEEFSSVFGWDRVVGQDQPVPVSRTIVRRVLNEGVAILNSDVTGGDASQAAESLLHFQIRSVLAVPLMSAHSAPLGVIYLDTRSPQIRFNEDHLQLVTAIAGIAAMALENARYVDSLESENRRLEAEIGVDHNMVGESPKMREVYQFIARVAATDSTILIRGESGTGKELVARAIHKNSPRGGKPFVAINCAAIAETLLESELFGHEKGAFTGAIAQKKGKLEVAHGGTVFLDEIGEVSPIIQAKLLRAVQEREFERVGGTRPIKVDVRFVAATNQDLESAIRVKTFRQDLYYRLSVVSVTVPPLRQRREDIPLLANYFSVKYSERCKRRVRGISPQARACLVSYDWPGNVRELENAIERAVVLGSSDFIRPEDLPEAVLDAGPSPGLAPPTKYHEAVHEAKKQLILRAIEQAKGNYTEAARLLDLHPNYLHRLIRNMNLRELVKK